MSRPATARRARLSPVRDSRPGSRKRELDRDLDDELRAHLGRRGIATGVHYPQIVACLPACAHLGCTAADFPVAAALQDEILSLPLFPELEPGQTERVVAAIKEFYAG